VLTGVEVIAADVSRFKNCKKTFSLSIMLFRMILDTDYFKALNGISWCLTSLFSTNTRCANKKQSPRKNYMFQLWKY